MEGLGGGKGGSWEGEKGECWEGKKRDNQRGAWVRASAPPKVHCISRNVWIQAFCQKDVVVIEKLTLE